MSVAKILMQPTVIFLIAGVITLFAQFSKNCKVVRSFSVLISIISSGVATIFSLINLIKFKEPIKLYYGNFVIDRFSLICSFLICLLAYFSILIMSNTDDFEHDAFSAVGKINTGIWPLSLFSITGMLFLVSTDDIISIFVALELMTIPLYLAIVQNQKKKHLSLESSIKYLVLGGISSAILLFGMAFVFGSTKSLLIANIIRNLQPSSMDPVLMFGMALMFIGFLFKIGAVPFHWWVPDVYEGAPTPFSGFMASLVKLAAFGGFMRIVFAICPSMDLNIYIIPVAILTVVIGTLLAVSQKNIKRLLAYSSINHAGFVLIAIAGFTEKAIYSSLFYLTVYSIAVIGSFGILFLLRTPDLPKSLLDSTKNPTLKQLKVLKPTDNDSIKLTNLAGFGKTNPLIATCLSIFFLSFAGIPLTAGFIAKYSAFTTNAPLYLVIIGILMSAIALFFYAKVIYSMFFLKPSYSTAVLANSDVVPFVLIVVLAVLIILLGIYPNFLISVLEKSAIFYI